MKMGCIGKGYLRKNIIKHIVPVCMVLLVVPFFSSQAVPLDGDISLVEILPSEVNATTLTLGDTFSVEIYVTPIVPIAGMQCEIYFNPSYLQVVNVTFGDLFDGYNSYQHGPIINNTGGYLSEFFDVILIPGFNETINPGVFATLKFLVNSTNPSDTLISLHDVILGDGWAMAVPIEVHNCTLLFNGVSFPPWDIDMDGFVGPMDLTFLAMYWLETGTPGWIRSDIDMDGFVGPMDLTFLAMHWLETSI